MDRFSQLSQVVTYTSVILAHITKFHKKRKILFVCHGNHTGPLIGVHCVLEEMVVGLYL